MPIDYISFEDAKSFKGIRMTAVKDIPSPWAEAAKGMLHVKKVPWKGVYFDPMNTELHQWSGVNSAPALKQNGHEFISDWQDILIFLEEQSSSLPLLPDDDQLRAKVLEISELICGKNGLGWTRRLENVHRSLNNQEGKFPEFIAHYIGNKYGYDESAAADYSSLVVQQLRQLSEILKTQNEKGSPFYVGKHLSAADIYSATFMGLFSPLPEELCQMNKMVRSVFSYLSSETEQALDPILLKHRDFIYKEFLELPLSL